MDIVMCSFLVFLWFLVGFTGLVLEEIGVGGFTQYYPPVEQQIEEVDDTMFYTSMWLSMESD